MRGKSLRLGKVPISVAAVATTTQSLREPDESLLDHDGLALRKKAREEADRKELSSFVLWTRPLHKADITTTLQEAGAARTWSKQRKDVASEIRVEKPRSLKAAKEAYIFQFLTMLKTKENSTKSNASKKETKKSRVKQRSIPIQLHCQNSLVTIWLSAKEISQITSSKKNLSWKARKQTMSWIFCCCCCSWQKKIHGCTLTSSATS